MSKTNRSKTTKIKTMKWTKEQDEKLGKSLDIGLKLFYRDMSVN
jgi:hypothetical protein